MSSSQFQSVCAASMPANATWLFPDDVGSHNIVPDNLCNGSIILADNLWRPSHYPSGKVAP